MWAAGRSGCAGSEDGGEGSGEAGGAIGESKVWAAVTGSGELGWILGADSMAAGGDIGCARAGTRPQPAIKNAEKQSKIEMA